MKITLCIGCIAILFGFARCKKIIVECNCNGKYFGYIEVKRSKSVTKKVCCNKNIQFEYVGDISINPRIIHVRVDSVEGELEKDQFKKNIGEYTLMFSEAVLGEILLYYEIEF